MGSDKRQKPVRSRDVMDLMCEPDADASGKQQERRKHRRRDALQHVSVETPLGRTICDLIDLSPTGARLRISNGVVPPVGTPLNVTLMDGTAIQGRVTWVGQNNIGVTLNAALGDVDALLSFEDLGDAYYAAALKLQRVSQKL